LLLGPSLASLVSMEGLTALTYNYEPLTLTMLGDPDECMVGEMMELAKSLKVFVENVAKTVGVTSVRA